MFHLIYKYYKTKYESRFINKRKEFSKYQVGDWTYGKPRVVTYGFDSQLKIGRFCSIADNVVIFLGGEHHHNWVTTYNFNEMCPGRFPNYVFSKGDVVIGSDVWIGHGVVILSGVTIGDGAVIGANAVVTKNVSPYSVVGGVPAKHSKYRFSEEQIKQLQKLRWWEWPMEKIREAWPLLLSPDIDEFIKKYKS